MATIILAGATGYLGSHLVKAMQDQHYSFKAIARNNKKLIQMGLNEDQILQAEATQAQTLKGLLEGADILISTIGITRQKDGLTYMDVDYQANLNLLEEAKKAGVKKFIYVAAINGDKMRHLKIMAAKEQFVDALKVSGMEYIIVRPNGFFSDMKDFLEMAKKGKVYLFGNGNFKLNPIHGEDLAKVILDTIDQSNVEIEVGGPDILSQNEIAEMALNAHGKSIKILHLPDWIRKAAIILVRVFSSSKTYGPIEFFLSMMGQDNIAPRYGILRLQSFFIQTADSIGEQIDKH